MGIIKFEVDIPEFQDELTISLTIKRDGEVVETISPTTPKAIEPLDISGSGVEEKLKTTPIKKTKKGVTSSSISGNLMDLDADF